MATTSQGSSPKKLKHSQDALAEDLILPSSAEIVVSMSGVPLSPVKSSESGSQNSEDLNDYDSDASSYYGDIMSDQDEDLSFHNETLSLQAQFDAVDLPPGVEAPIPWLEHPSQSQNPTTSSSASSSQLTCHSGEGKKNILEVCLPQPADSQIKPAGKSSSTLINQSSSTKENEEKDEDDVMNKFTVFNQFDTVQDFLDHHFTEGDSKPKQAPQNWTKKIQHEWKLLEKDLPAEIFVRVCEERMDLLRAVIVGAPGTPYHDGLFFFDVFFPPGYPNVPPQVFYYSGGLRLNPNLYNCGKVCLSLLNTWHGKKNELWSPGHSTILQVLLSIQALVLNEKPFFNEPGFDHLAGGQEGEVKSKDYNEETFILSCKTMLYTLRRPPKHYEDFVAGHFRERAHAILLACKAYMEGGEVGDSLGEASRSGSRKLKEEVSKIIPRLVEAFSRNGNNSYFLRHVHCCRDLPKHFVRWLGGTSLIKGLG